MTATWCDADNEPYSSSDWWHTGNFLLDGHNNASFGAGTFSIQLYGGANPVIFDGRSITSRETSGLELTAGRRGQGVRRQKSLTA